MFQHSGNTNYQEVYFIMCNHYILRTADSQSWTYLNNDVLGTSRPCRKRYVGFQYQNNNIINNVITIVSIPELA